jgi:hypothetical protein
VVDHDDDSGILGLAGEDVKDLVITVDTSVAHLAGAAGLPVWVFVSRFSD